MAAKASKLAQIPSSFDPHRSLVLDDVLGSELIKRFLRLSMKESRLPQSLLLAGPRGIGKTTIAWAIAREIIAQGDDPRLHSGSLKVVRGTHPDIIEITSKESLSSMILVGQIRDIEDRIATSPLESTHKIVLIEPAERMNEAAANGLLKILEEPPSHVIFILLSADPNRLLPTIRSRCAILNLDPVEPKQLAAWLCRQKPALELQTAILLAQLAEGRPGTALHLSEMGVLESRNSILDALKFLLQYGFSGIFNVTHRFLSLKIGLAETFTMATMLLRDALVIASGGANQVLNRDLFPGLEELAITCSVDGLINAAQRFANAAAQEIYYYSSQSRAHFVECVIADVGRALKYRL